MTIPDPPTDLSAPAPGTARIADGRIAVRVLDPGEGDRHPRSDSLVILHYTGWTAAGRMFDTTLDDGKTKGMNLKDAVWGMSQAVQSMVEGQRALFWIPADLAYGEAPSNPRLPAGPLVFEIELVRIARL